MKHHSFGGKLEEDTVKMFLIHPSVHPFPPFLSVVLYLCIWQISPCHDICVEVRGTTCRSWFSPSPYRFLTSVLGHQDWWQATLSTELSHHFTLPSFLSIFWWNLNTYLVVANSPPLFFASIPTFIPSVPFWLEYFPFCVDITCAQFPLHLFVNIFLLSWTRHLVSWPLLILTCI